MSKMILLVVGALTALAFTALAGTATAKETKLRCEGEGRCLFVGTSGQSTFSMTNNDTVKCESGEGEGEVTGLNAERESTTGLIQVRYKGCKEQLTAFHFACTTPGQASGNVTSNVMTVHSIALPGTAHEAGVLLTNANITFTCAGGFASTQVTGNVIGESEEKCNTNTGKAHTTNFTTTGHGLQSLTSYTGVTFKLEGQTAHTGGAYASFAKLGTASLTFNQNVILTCA